MNHPDIPKQNGNFSEFYDTFPSEYNTNTKVKKIKKKHFNWKIG